MHRPVTLARHRARPLALGALALACSQALAASVAPSLLAEAEAGGRVDALIVLPDQSPPSLAPLAPDADYRVRRRALVDALRARAGAQQADLLAWLDARGIEHRAYWITNLVWARVSPAQLAELARRDDVARIEGNPQLPLSLPTDEAAGPGTQAIRAIEYGVEKINAPAVWALGYTGQGVVIAGADTGIRWDHAALKPHYRGWDGSSASHDYNWHDAIHDASGNACGNNAPAPCDDNSHGTHTVGTFAGDDGGANRIGVAPGAKWIGCRNMAGGFGTPARYIECMQWTLAPTDLAGQNPDPDLAPDVVSNSWGCIPSEGCTSGQEIRVAVDNVVAGGIFFAAAAGNDGPSCNSITDPPATYDSAFVVGATDSLDRVASFSGRGPVAGLAPSRPDVAAPGVGTRSATHSSTTSYGIKSGTSMATPHVAGAAALLMSVNPALKGHPDQVAQLLRGTAVTAGVTDPYNSGCGGLTLANHPNHQVGWGRIDVLAAAQAAMPSEAHTVTPGVDGDGGTISPDAPQLVDDGDTIAFSLVADADHHLVRPVGGSCPGTLVDDTVYVAGPIHADCSVTARFAIDEWTVRASAGPHGTVTPASQLVDAGASAMLAITPDPGYVVDTVDGDTCGVASLAPGSYATGPIHADCAIVATFVPDAGDTILRDGFDGA